MSNSSHLLGPDPKLFMCVCGCVGTQPVCTESWMTEEYDACVSIYFCVIASDLGLCLLQIVAVLVEADSVKERPVAFVLKLL